MDQGFFVHGQFGQATHGFVYRVSFFESGRPEFPVQPRIAS